MISKLFTEPDRLPIGDECLPDLLASWVRTHPDRTAVVHGNQRLSYGELAASAGRIAAQLRRLGVGADDCVGIFVEPSLDLVVGAWAILLAGGAYLPLAPEYPEDRLRYMIEDARATTLFTQDALVARLADLAPRTARIVTPRAPAGFAANDDAAPCSCGGIRPETLAYVIYTSGSTGRPKGVMIEHRSIASQMRWLERTYRLSDSRVILQKTPMSFDAAQWEILSPACGATVVIAPPGSYREPERLIESILEHRVTTLQCVPTLLQALVDTEQLHTCASLQQIFCGGEALSRSLAVQCAEALPGCEVVNLYGPTECTINSSAFTVDRTTMRDGPATISIGAPVEATQYHLLDPQRRPVAPGETGELYIGGIQLARGYLHQPELTAKQFVAWDGASEPGASEPVRLFKTGDLAYANPDGTLQFVGRVDNQVKLRGYRVELDEIRIAIENHDWVKTAGVIVKDDPATGFDSLVAFVELNPREAAVMDQGNHGAHHQSKHSRLQVSAQLANLGCRDADELRGRPTVELPHLTPSSKQRRRVFARKTYRFYEGAEPIAADDLLRLLARRPQSAGSRGVDQLRLDELGEILRYFGQHHSDERLLPKYGYASPGALYATQLYLDLERVAGVPPGTYYYHPLHHQLVQIRATRDATRPRLAVHFLGKRRAIEPVYKNNIQEVLEIEAGHMVGLFEEILPDHGLGIVDRAFAPGIRHALDCAADDAYLGSFEIVPRSAAEIEDAFSFYVQAHAGRIAGLPAAQYELQSDALTRISDDLIEKRHVIAINQRVYDRSSFGITVIARTAATWRSYIDLGRALQRLSMNDLRIGFMSSGYSSRTGNDLRSAERITSILEASGRAPGPSYFFVGGRISDDQQASEGMKEDTVHMQGPAEMIREDLACVLPDYMVPNRIVVLDHMPLTANGKLDVKALAALEPAGRERRTFVAPRTSIEQRIAELWQAHMRQDAASIHDNFFEAGGNSLIAVALINQINREFATSLPLQVVFESSTIEKLALRVGSEPAAASPRLVRLDARGSGRPVFCWPGLGGFPMNLRGLAGALDGDRPFYGVQAHGINRGELPLPSIQRMAAEDVAAIRRLQPSGPYALWGYSFGARVAFEAARELERAGQQVEHVLLLAPGSPDVATRDGTTRDSPPSYRNEAYLAILYSVFAGNITDPALDDCRRIAHDDDSFASFIAQRFAGLDAELIKRILRVVQTTYAFGGVETGPGLAPVTAPVTILRARGDRRSPFELAPGCAARPPAIVELTADHYSLLRPPGLTDLVVAIRHCLDNATKEFKMPHVNIKYFPVPLSYQQQTDLVKAITAAVQNAFHCDEKIISIALEPVEKDAWNDRVYVPEIVNRKDLLRKAPSY